MQFIIISYRSDYHSRRDSVSNDARFDISECNTEEAVVELLASILKMDTRATYVNLVLRKWDDLLAITNTSLYEQSGEDSIQVPGPYEESEDAQKEREELQARLQSAVADKLGTNSERHRKKLREEEKRRADEAYRKRVEADQARWEAERPAREAKWKREEEEKKAKELAEYERLKKKYGT